MHRYNDHDHSNSVRKSTHCCTSYFRGSLDETFPGEVKTASKFGLNGDVIYEYTGYESVIFTSFISFLLCWCFMTSEWCGTKFVFRAIFGSKRSKAVCSSLFISLNLQETVFVVSRALSSLCFTLTSSQISMFLADDNIKPKSGGSGIWSSLAVFAGSIFVLKLIPGIYMAARVFTSKNPQMV